LFTIDRNIQPIVSSWDCFDRGIKMILSGLLGSVEIPVNSLIERNNEQEDSLSIYSFATSHFSDMSIINWKRRTFSLQHSSTNSQLSLKYYIHFND